MPRRAHRVADFTCSLTGMPVAQLTGKAGRAGLLAKAAGDPRSVLGRGRDGAVPAAACTVER